MEPRILVVDDDTLIRRIMKDTLSALPATILEAATGEDAIAVAKAERPDLIFLDTMMPGMDGFQTAERLKLDATTAQIPLIFVSALGTSSHKVRGLDLGAEDYLSKPIDPEELKARTRSVLRRARPAAPPPAAPAPPPTTAALATGQLQAMPPVSLLRWLGIERRSGRLLLTRGGMEGEILLVDGMITRAGQGQRRGNAALFELLGWRDGTFEILALPEDAAARGGEVMGVSEDILQEGIRRLEEIPQLRADLPGPGIPLEVPPVIRAAVRSEVPPEAVVLLSLLDGSRHLDQILAESPVDSWMTLTLLHRLLQLGVLGWTAEPSGARRIIPRVPTEGALQYQVLRDMPQAICYTLSTRGMFIHTPEPYPVGEQVLLRFQMPGGTAWITAIGKVIWQNADSQEAKPDELGMGLQFTEIVPQALESIERWLSHGVAAELRSTLQAD